MKSEEIHSNESSSSRITPPNLQRAWEEIQRKYYLEKCLLIDYNSNDEADNYWRWHLDIPKYKSPIKANHRAQFGSILKGPSFRVNDDLKIIFQKGFNRNTLLWSKFEESIQPKGFFVPKGELVRLGKETTAQYLLYLKLKAKFFPFIEFLKKLKTEMMEPELAEVPIVLIALWEYIPLYAKFLKRILNDKAKEFKLLKELFGEVISPRGFSQKLPSEQIWDLIQSEFQVQYFGGMTHTDQAPLIKNAHQEVQQYWERYCDSIRFIIENGYPAISKRSMGNRKMIYTGKEASMKFYNLSKTELEWMKIQEVMAPLFENKYSALPLDNTRWKFRADREKDLNNTLKEAIGDKSILDRIKESSSGTPTLKKPNFNPPAQEWLPDDGQKWFDFSIDERSEILSSVEKDLSLFQQKELAVSAKKRWDLHLQDIGNQVFGPFLTWTTVADALVPQWNVLQGDFVTHLDEEFEKIQTKQIEELKWLAAVTKKLYSRTTLRDAQKVVAQVKPFSFDHLQQQWDRTVSVQLGAIRHKGEYRLRRMKEFGMLKVNQKPDKSLEQWLDELLLIEKEIGPYIPYVKQAFLMALPSKTSVEFDPYRHSHDGIEFDPETTQDQHKWLRGEVMKSLRSRTGKSDAEQINAFALDFSGSMRHKRMRNLFKILYLMVLGLEDRKSYDAFHFFGSDFIETVNFSSDYTNRSLLFTILRQIARIDYEGVRYGGIGGTNMSQGIIQCHERIKAFAKTLKEKYPKRFFLKSIFVITDGEPSLGIHVPQVLNLEINKRRKDGNVAIKGIYLKPEKEEYASFMELIFGKDQFVETTDFSEAVNRLVYIMSQTYKRQRIDLRQQKIKEKYERSRNLYQ